MTTLENNYLGPYGFDYSQLATSLEPAGYNDGIYNDPLWTKQGVDWLPSTAARSSPGSASSRCSTRTTSPTSRAASRADVTRPDWEVELPLNFDDDTTTKPTVHTQYADGAALIRGGIADDDTATWKRLLNTYCDLIVNTDDNLGAIVKALAASGGLEDTVIIRTSDHGEMAASHRGVGKGPTIYEEQLRMPLSISWPKRFAAGARTPALAEAVDIVPTCLELAGVARSRLPLPLAARPLAGARVVKPGKRRRRRTSRSAPATRSGRRPTSPAPGGRGGATSAPRCRATSRSPATSRWTASRRSEIPGDQEYELYDLSEDPYELRNLADDPAYKPLLDDLLARLHELEKERFAPVEVPDYGGASLIEPIRPDPIGRPRDADSDGIRSPVEGLPGAYVQLPFGDPHLERRVYEAGGVERVPQTADESRAAAEARARRARRCSASSGHRG